MLVNVTNLGPLFFEINYAAVTNAFTDARFIIMRIRRRRQREKEQSLISSKGRFIRAQSIATHRLGRENPILFSVTTHGLN
jgi:hypothetical protein